ncbi:MAG: CD3324 family protein [Oscillospiraceae bacterium]
MKYKNAQDILPDNLLKELQQYISGETLYVPNIGNKKRWGEVSGSRSYYKRRNEAIREKFRQGGTIEKLAEEFHLSEDTIKKIVY